MTTVVEAEGRGGRAKRVALVLAGSVLIAVAAQVRVPFWPVPMTLQTLAILVLALGLGSRMGGAAE